MRQLHLPTPKSLDLKPGDRVIVGVSGHRTLAAAGTLYLGSILSLLLGAGVFAALGRRYLSDMAGDYAALGGAVVGFAAYLWAARKWGLVGSLAAEPVIRERL